MKEITSPKKHLVVCCRTRDDGKACCADQGAIELVSNLKNRVRNAGLKGQVKVSQSSCLGHCEAGIAACLYPENKWMTLVNLKDEEALWQTLTSNLIP